jgi:lysyl-tRNA synthetase class 2
LGDGVRWLQTSPEFGMKRLLASGAKSIYQIAKCFRGGESGARHNPEFTMLEWYRAGDDYAAGMRLLDELAAALFERGAAERLSYRDAFQRCLELDPHTATWDQLAAAASTKQLGVDGDFSRDRDDWLDLLLSECVQPALGRGQPTIVYDYPASQAALARTRTCDGVEVAERFELFVEGVELANGYHELLNADELRRRNERANAARQADGRRCLPSESRLLAAMDAGLAACSGCALGVDRLVMLTLGVDEIDQVIAFPFERA